TEEMYRQWVVRQVTDPVVSSFWLNEFETYDKSFRNEVISPVLNKVGQFLMSPIVRNILGQVKNRIDFRHILDKQQIFIANLAKGQIGEEKASLLGALIVSQFELAGMARAGMPLEDRSHFSLCIDEFHSVVTESFC